MANDQHNISFKAGLYIAHLFNSKLSADLVFHNFHHTTNVVRGGYDIGQQVKVSKEALEVLTLAAWFHDSGHTAQYQGHEQASMSLVHEWLSKENYSATKIDDLLSLYCCYSAPPST